MKKTIPLRVINCEKDNMNVYDVHLVNSEVISIRTNLDYFDFLKTLFERDCFVQLVGCQFKVAICKEHIMYVSNKNLEIGEQLNNFMDLMYGEENESTEMEL